MWCDKFGHLLAKFWLKKITWCDRCFLPNMLQINKIEHYSVLSGHPFTFVHSRANGSLTFLFIHGLFFRNEKAPFVHSHTIDTEIKVKLISQQYFGAFAFVLILIGADGLSHSCPHRYFASNSVFAFAFVILKVMKSENHVVSLRFNFCVHGIHLAITGECFTHSLHSNEYIHSIHANRGH